MGSLSTSNWKKAMKLTLILLGRGFNSSKCKTVAKMAVSRIKLLRNKRLVVVKQMRRDIAMLLESGQDATARIRVEHVIREQNILAANEFIELFCELVVARLPIIAKRRECPADLKEGISSLIFSAPRCADIPELTALRDIFKKKYGKDLVSAATDLRPDCAVNRMLIDKLSARTPAGEVKLKVMKEIAKEYMIEWDTKESEIELLKPLEELVEGPQSFVSAASLPIKPMPKRSVEESYPSSRYSDENKGMNFENTASAAEAAAESAKKAIAAAGAAAYLADKYSYNNTNTTTINRRHGYNVQSAAPSDFNFDESDNYDEEIEVEERTRPSRRQGSIVLPCGNSDIKFDESDCDEEEFEIEDRMTKPPNRVAPSLPLVHRVHPKLPDYDEVTERFEALKYRKF
jgi:vacuolar protein sorting-associated protein IST1